MPGSQAFVAATTVGVHCPTYNQARNISNRQPATCQIVKHQTEKCRGKCRGRNKQRTHSATRARHCVSTVPTTPSSRTVCAKSMEFAVIAWYTCNDRERLPNGMETVRGRERLANGMETAAYLRDIRHVRVVPRPHDRQGLRRATVNTTQGQ